MNAPGLGVQLLCAGALMTFGPAVWIALKFRDEGDLWRWFAKQPLRVHLALQASVACGIGLIWLGLSIWSVQ